MLRPTTEKLNRVDSFNSLKSSLLSLLFRLKAVVPSLSFFPIYILAISKLSHESIAVALLYQNTVSFLSLFDLGFSQLPYFGSASLSPSIRTCFFILAFQFLVSSVSIQLFFTVFLGSQVTYKVILLTLFTFGAFFSCINSHLRIYIDFLRPHTTTIAFARALPSYFRLFVLFFCAAKSFGGLDILITILLGEITIFLSLRFLLLGSKANPILPSRKFKWSSYIIHWITSLGISFLDLSIRKAFVAGDMFGKAVFFDILTRLLSLINAFGSLITSFILNRFDRLALEKYCLYLMYIFSAVWLIIYCLANSFQTIFLAGVFFLSILSTLVLASRRIMPLSLSKLVFISLCLAKLYA